MHEPAFAIGRIKATSPRHREWLAMLGREEVILESPKAVPAIVPVSPGSKSVIETMVYYVAIAHLSEEELQRIAHYLGHRFQLPPGDIVRGIKEQGRGIPVLASDVDVRIVDVHTISQELARWNSWLKTGSGS